jgi:ABC-type nitrate/sulfonate/bicarbonate transport system permease component
MAPKPRISLVQSDAEASARGEAPLPGIEKEAETVVAVSTAPSLSPVQRTLRLASRYSLLLLLFVVWELFSRNYPGLAMLLPAPSEVIKGGVELVKDGTLQRDILASLERVGVALGVASLIGFPLGTVLGSSRTFAWVVEPVVNFFRPIPPLAWIPLSIVWFGITDAQNEFIIFLGAFFPIVVSTMQGVRDVDRQLIRAALTLGASRIAIAFTVVLPSALPFMVVGLRVGTGIAWMALVAGELVAATSGLGFLISQGRLLFRSDYIIVGMVMIGLIGLLLDAMIRFAQRLIMRWREE